MNNKRIIKNIGVSMAMKPISMALSLVYTPLALSFLGDAKYGIWAIILNIVSWINYFDIGIGNGLRNRLATAIALEEAETAKKYVSTAYVGTSIISICFCIIINLVWNAFELGKVFNLTMPDENVNLVVFISVSFVCINFILSLSKTSAYAIQQPGIISVAGVLGQTLQIIGIILISRLFDQNLLVIAVLYGIVSLFDSTFVYLIVTCNRNYLKPRVSFADRKYMRPLLTLGVGFFLIQISSLVLNTTDNILISTLYGSAEVTPYSIVYKVFYMVVQIHAIIIMPMWSAYTEALAKNDIGWIKKTTKKINGITLLFSAAVILFIPLFEPVAAIWLHKRLNYGKTLIILVALYMIVQMFANNYSSLLCGVGYIRASTIVSVIGAVLNIPLSILFAEYFRMNLSGVIMGSLIVMTMSVVVLPITSHKWISEISTEWEKS